MKTKQSSIRRGDRVKLNVPYQLFSNEVIPAGTELMVFRAKQNGVLYCSQINGSGYTVTVNSSKVTKIDRVEKKPKVGDIFVSSYGWEQTNIDYYEVVEVLPSSVRVREIAQSVKRDGFLSGHCKPIPGHFTGEPRLFRVTYDGQGNPGIKVASYAWARLTKPDAEHFFSEWA